MNLKLFLLQKGIVIYTIYLGLRTNALLSIPAEPIEATWVDSDDDDELKETNKRLALHFILTDLCIEMLSDVAASA